MHRILSEARVGLKPSIFRLEILVDPLELTLKPSLVRRHISNWQIIMIQKGV